MDSKYRMLLFVHSKIMGRYWTT